jgi:hypothetical protein
MDNYMVLKTFLGTFLVLFFLWAVILIVLFVKYKKYKKRVDTWFNFWDWMEWHFVGFYSMHTFCVIAFSVITLFILGYFVGKLF